MTHTPSREDMEHEADRLAQFEHEEHELFVMVECRCGAELAVPRVQADQSGWWICRECIISSGLPEGPEDMLFDGDVPF